MSEIITNPENEFPVLPLRDIVVFPNSAIPLFVGREKSINALDVVTDKYKKIILVAQKNSEVDDPKEKDVYSYGTLGEILQLLKLPDGTVKILVEGKHIVKILNFKENDKYLLANSKIIDSDDKNPNAISLSKAIINKYDKLSKISKKLSDDNVFDFKKENSPIVVA